MTFTTHMDRAIEAAREAGARGEVPVGAVLVSGTGEVLAVTSNRCRELNDVTAHAEILAIREASKSLNSERLTGCSLYITLEPCAMCAGAISAARIEKLYYGASDPKSGGVAHGARVFSHPQAHHKPDIYDGISETACADLLVNFFQGKRDAGP